MAANSEGARVNPGGIPIEASFGTLVCAMCERVERAFVRNFTFERLAIAVLMVVIAVLCALLMTPGPCPNYNPLHCVTSGETSNYKGILKTFTTTTCKPSA